MLICISAKSQQKHYPDFGVPTTAELFMSSCSLDAGADVFYFGKDLKVFHQDYTKFCISYTVSGNKLFYKNIITSLQEPVLIKSRLKREIL